MTAAYGFSITIAMLMTTYLMAYYLRYVKKYPAWLVGATVSLFVLVETSFFVANAVKIVKRLAFLVVELGLFTTMYIWYRGRKIGVRFTPMVDVDSSLAALNALSVDATNPKYATHVVYITASTESSQLEKEIIDSIFARQSKRADVYWFVHVEFTDEPFTTAYRVEEFENDRVIRVDFRLGFRVQPRINFLLRKVVEDMVERQELAIFRTAYQPNEADVRGIFALWCWKNFYLTRTNYTPGRSGC